MVPTGCRHINTYEAEGQPERSGRVPIHRICEDCHEDLGVVGYSTVL